MDDFFRFNRRAVLQHKGKVSRQDMEAKVKEELQKYRERGRVLEDVDKPRLPERRNLENAEAEIHSAGNESTEDHVPF